MKIKVIIRTHFILFTLLSQILLTQNLLASQQLTTLELSKAIKKKLDHKVILFLGFPGAGKGTQGKLVSQQLKIPHLSTGELYRREAASGSQIGKEMQFYMKEGKVIPYEVYSQTFFAELRKDQYKKGHILDGYPKEEEHLAVLDEIHTEQNYEIAAVLYFKINRENVFNRLIGRLMCQKCESNFHQTLQPPKEDGLCDNCHSKLSARKDDTREAIATRLDVFEHETAPLVRYFQERNLLYTIEADQSIKDVNKQILKTLYKALYNED